MANKYTCEKMHAHTCTYMFMNFWWRGRESDLPVQTRITLICTNANASCWVILNFHVFYNGTSIVLQPLRIIEYKMQTKAKLMYNSHAKISPRSSEPKI